MMKTSSELSSKLTKQWHRTELRVERLLSAEAWPIILTIGKPSNSELSQQTLTVKQHISDWKSNTIGEVIWEIIKYRAGTEPIKIPVKWHLRNPSEWIAACKNIAVSTEFEYLESLINTVSSNYWELLIRERSLWRNKDLQEVITMARIADKLQPGAALGRPLRLMAGLDVDTKFFERHKLLLTRLLDERYQGEASEQGLLNFLNAHEENKHWILVAPLEDNLLPFKRQRVTSSELYKTPLPSTKILIVENEQCLHQLPTLADTIAILGAGLDLHWLSSPVFDKKIIAYWGDMDTWGLVMLAQARHHRPNIKPLLMNKHIFEQCKIGCAVYEKVTAGKKPPDTLTDSEKFFYHYLLTQEKGRLEQEYLPINIVHQEINNCFSQQSNLKN